MGAADVANIRDLVGDTAWTLYADAGLFDSASFVDGPLAPAKHFHQHMSGPVRSTA